MSKLDELHARYMAALHGVQTGIEYKRQYDRKFVNEKHMRTGIDSAHISQAAVVRLLIVKGVFTEDEYMEALAIEAEAEKSRLEIELSAHYGAKITLG